MVSGAHPHRHVRGPDPNVSHSISTSRRAATTARGEQGRCEEIREPYRHVQCRARYPRRPREGNAACGEHESHDEHHSPWKRTSGRRPSRRQRFSSRTVITRRPSSSIAADWQVSTARRSSVPVCAAGASGKGSRATRPIQSNSEILPRGRRVTSVPGDEPREVSARTTRQGFPKDLRQ